MSDLSTVEILRGAKAVLERNGWTQGDFFDHEQWDGGTPPNECRVCLRGAVNIVAAGHPVHMPIASGRAADVLDELVGNAIRWNDAEDRTVDEVYALLDAAIARAEAVSGA